MPLTPKEEKFCQEYVKCLNKTKAAIKAGYSKDNARQIGHENLTKLDIQERVKEIQAEIREQMGIDEHSILMDLRALSDWNIRDYIDTGNTIKDLSKMAKSKTKPVAGIEVKERYLEDGSLERKTTLKFPDKRGALVDLGKHLGIFEKDNKQRAAHIQVGYEDIDENE